ncbi:phosphate ABC transporter permease PstA [Alkaliflexus imshenetskii]|uniref:phosphate ABC transporter permease PstA n=1 Tax=Alkaliflexus imshenetskii TaxID=286730 RepID=UPI0004B2E837|nr:phosphate ABC transporter permease PstA [Alkaliflexus imshenetskii]
MNRLRKIEHSLGYLIVTICAIIVLLFLAVILFDIFSKGAGVLSWSFITESPREGMSAGGVFPALMGTLIVTLITIVFSFPIGVATAIYLNEYAKQNFTTRLIRASIRNLAGVPSIVYGLFGVALFVQAMSMGRSVLASGLTLGVLTLPWIVTTAEEALKNIPRSFRDGSLALGATKWETVRYNVLPYAMPGILTGGILGISRASGETAPILFTGVAFFLPELPGSLFDQFMALPYHLYIMSTQHHAIELVRPIAYGTAFLLIALVFGLNLTAIIIRYRLRKKYKM